MTDRIREQMEGWAHWRHYRHGGLGKTILQRVLEGMPGTGCPTCAGKGRASGALIGRKGTFIACPTCGGNGRVKLDASDYKIRTRPCPHCFVKTCEGDKGRSTGEVNGRTCIQCGGSGVLVRETDKVNPAFITSTYCEPDHPTYQRIDRLVCELKRRDVLLGYFFVVDAEYCDRRGGTQTIKAERLGIGFDSYRKRLQRALEWIDASVPDRRECFKIPFPWRPEKYFPEPEKIACKSCHKTLSFSPD